jgi:NAD(P)-dependent dehydrogenase (short-subunit alcohol dehydrogenase family)
VKLQGKAIVVAGAAGQIGRRIAAGALQAGARVYAIDARAEGLAELEAAAARPDALACSHADVTDAQSVRRVFVEIEQRFGEVSGAVNASYPRSQNYGRGFLDVTYEDFAANVAVHLGGYFVFMQECVRYSMQGPRPFSLVNLSSIYGVMPPRFEIYAGTSMTMPVEYAAIKAGLQHMTRYANVYARGSGFRANCVSPGGILAGQDSRFLEQYNRHCLRKGMLDADDVVPSVLFLLSDASAFVAGQNLVVDDGFSL